MEEKNNNLNSNEKGTKIKSKKIMAIIIAIVVVAFLSANVFATTQGYDNIFFMIRNLIQGETEITDRDQILSDRDITVSYQPIEVLDGLKLQINRLVVKDNNATLFLNLEISKELEDSPKEFVVYDVTNEKKLLGQQKLTGNTDVISKFEEKVNLSNFSEDTNTLQLEINDENEENMITLEIKLDKKEIDVVSKANINEFEKISEVELKEFLADVVRINYFNDWGSANYLPEKSYRNDIKVTYALELLEKTQATTDEVHEVIKEFSGEDNTNVLELAQVIVEHENGYYKYIEPNDMLFNPIRAICLSTSDLKYSNGIYSVNCVYVLVRNEDYEENRIEDLQKFTTKIEFKINKEYEYSKFSMLNINEFTSKPYEVIRDDSEITETINPDNSEEDETPEVSDSESNISSDIVDNTEDNIAPDYPGNDNVDKESHNSEEKDSSDNNETELLPNLEDVDNYASTMEWNDFFTPGLRGIMPADWKIEKFMTLYTGIQDDGKLATTVSGVAMGKNPETNEIVKSNVIINFYMPENTDVQNSFEYAKIIANRYGMEASEAGFTSKEGMEWKMAVKPYSNRQFYCHLNPVMNSMGNMEGTGYVVEIICDNYENYKVINIINRIFGNLKGASF